MIENNNAIVMENNKYFPLIIFPIFIHLIIHFIKLNSKIILYIEFMFIIKVRKNFLKFFQIKNRSQNYIYFFYSYKMNEFKLH